MAWFKVDDKLPNHHKTRSVRKSHPVKRRDASPFGIWALAGAWSDDGYVPLEWLEDQDDHAFELAERLVQAGLWHHATRDGEEGYVFHDWHAQNPARGENDPSVTGTFGNHIRWHVQRKIADPDCRHCPTEPDDLSADDRPRFGPISPPDIGEIAPESLPSRPVPTRTRPEPEPTTSSDKSDTTDEPDRFDEFWEAYGKKVKRADAERRWAKALKKNGVTADLLIAAASSYVAYEREHNAGGRYIADPSTWLNGERWRDERPPPPEPPQSRARGWLQLAADLGDIPSPEQPRQIGTGR